MDDLVTRLLLVAAAMGAALAISWSLQRRSRRPGRSITNHDLDPGFHYFSSPTCDTCREARAMLDRRLGAGGYTEHAWNLDPDVFGRLGVDEVPALIVVAEDGSARIYAGRLEPAVEMR